MIADGDDVCVPCGGCRQRLREFMRPRREIHLCSPGAARARRRRSATLLPRSFGPEFLRMSAAEALAERAGFAPRLGIVLGSGLGGLADALADAVAVPYAELAGFPRRRRRPRRARSCSGDLSGLPVACFQGRKHVYEGGDPGAMRGPVRALQGARRRGAARHQRGRLAAPPRSAPGALMAIADHINLLGVNPLTGPNDDAIGPRFPSLRDAYDPELRAALQRRRRRRSDIDLAEGVYLATAGPSFETPAEIRAFRTLGADAVGMSTVPEVILARHAGCASPRSRRSPTSPRAWAARSSRTSRRCATPSVAARDLVPPASQTFAEDSLTLLAPEVIRRKRDGDALTRRGDRASWSAASPTAGCRDAQVGALAMAFFLRGHGRATSASR